MVTGYLTDEQNEQVFPVTYMLLWPINRAEQSKATVLQSILEHHAELKYWQAIQEPDVQLWLVIPRSERMPDDLQNRIAIEGFVFREFSTLKQWQSTEAEIVNFVLRELRANTIDEIVPQIHQQIEAVITRPGCVGCTLATEVGKPQNLLGATYWQDEMAFEDYCEWASQHAWRDIISPLTLQVPLRVLVRRINEVNGNRKHFEKAN